MTFFNLTDDTLSIIESTTTKIHLQPNEINAVKLLSINLNKEFNTLELLEEGITSSPQCMWRLKQKGAIIESTLRTITDEFGEVHTPIAPYKIAGSK
jgi:hypothetical protein